MGGHTPPLRQAPDYEGPPPVNVYLNKERMAGINAAKEANSKRSGQPLKPIKAPSAEAIAKYKKAKRESQ